MPDLAERVAADASVLSLRGIGVSPGVTAGPAYRMAAVPALPVAVPAVQDPLAEGRQAVEALAAVADELNHRADSAAPTAAEVLRAEAMIAADPTLADTVVDLVAAGRAPAWAISDAIAEQRAAFTAMGGYFAERAADLDDIRDRAVAHLLGLPMPGVPDPGEPFVLIADDLAPADTATLDPAVVVGLVTQRGGPTGHTAILAKALGLPAVVACPGALAVPEGTVLRVDGQSGAVEQIDPAAADGVRQEAAAARAAVQALTGPGRTSDGHPVKLLLNVGSAADVDGVSLDGIEGVGLFRTEFLFLGRTEAPSAAEQEEAYVALFRAMGGRKIVLRTLDAGADKPLPFLRLADEDNPALGVRGLRVVRVQPAVLADQLDAVARAAKATSADVWVMAPMVATRPEAAAFAERVHAAGLPIAGAMVEVPAAALRAASLLEVVDFLSIGTNDLSQYTLAADRMCGELADLLDPWQPALLQLIESCAVAGRAVDKPVSICGEAASDPLLALVLVGLGITSLSMSPRSIAAVRASLAGQTLARCGELAALALAAPDAVTGRAAVEAAIA